jgi:hypothetical protein
VQEGSNEETFFESRRSAGGGNRSSLFSKSQGVGKDIIHDSERAEQVLRLVATAEGSYQPSRKEA